MFDSFKNFIIKTFNVAPKQSEIVLEPTTKAPSAESTRKPRAKKQTPVSKTSETKVPKIKQIKRQNKR